MISFSLTGLKKFIPKFQILEFCFLFFSNWFLVSVLAGSTIDFLKDVCDGDFIKIRKRTCIQNSSAWNQYKGPKNLEPFKVTNRFEKFIKSFFFLKIRGLETSSSHSSATFSQSSSQILIGPPTPPAPLIPILIEIWNPILFANCSSSAHSVFDF